MNQVESILSLVHSTRNKYFSLKAILFIMPAIYAKCDYILSNSII